MAKKIIDPSATQGTTPETTEAPYEGEKKLEFLIVAPYAKIFNFAPHVPANTLTTVDARVKRASMAHAVQGTVIDTVTGVESDIPVAGPVGLTGNCSATFQLPVAGRKYIFQIAVVSGAGAVLAEDSEVIETNP